MYIIIVTVICVVSMLGLIPLLLKLKPISNIKYLDIDDESNLKLDDTLAKSIDFIKVNKNELNLSTAITVYPFEKTRSVEFTIAIKTKNKIKIKGYKLKFKYCEEIKIDFKEPFEQIAIYVNRINDGVKQQRIIQYVPRANVEAFIALEWAGAALASCTLISDFIIHSSLYVNFLNHGFGWYYFLLCIAFVSLIIIAGYFLLRYVTFWYLGKYIYGGKFDARN